MKNISAEIISLWYKYKCLEINKQWTKEQTNKQTKTLMQIRLNWYRTTSVCLRLYYTGGRMVFVVVRRSVVHDKRARWGDRLILQRSGAVLHKLISGWVQWPVIIQYRPGIYHTPLFTFPGFGKFYQTSENFPVLVLLQFCTIPSWNRVNNIQRLPKILGTEY